MRLEKDGVIDRGDQSFHQQKTETQRANNLETWVHCQKNIYEWENIPGALWKLLHQTSHSLFRCWPIYQEQFWNKWLAKEENAGSSFWKFEDL